MTGSLPLTIICGIALTLAVGCQPRDVAEGVHEALADPCGPDLIDLYAQRDPETVALFERSTAEFGATARERTRCLAEAGDVDAQLNLAVDLRDGAELLPQNYAEAAVWFQRAAEQGNPVAMFNLGQLYTNGRGVPQDLVQAHMWFNLAFSGLDWDAPTRPRAFERRNQVESRMSNAEVREAQRLASEWSAARHN